MTYQEILAHVSELCKTNHRPTDSVTIIGASKKQSLETIMNQTHQGLGDLGENYAQELLEKSLKMNKCFPSDDSKIRWHFIGRLQRRKIKKLVPIVSLFHSLESIETAQTLNDTAQEMKIKTRALVQINLAAETSKGGLTKEKAAEFLASCSTFKNLEITGLMTLPPLTEDTEQCRPYFKALRDLRDTLNKRSVYHSPLTELSMGMSHDYPVAVAEGATMIRIGRLLFGERI